MSTLATNQRYPDLHDPRPGLKIAVMDNDHRFLSKLDRPLTESGHRYRTLEAAVPVAELAAMRVDVLLLDMRVIASAWDYLTTLQREVAGLPVVICTGPSTVAQRIRGLRLGADDWVSKPCNPDELTTRIEAVVRRRARITAAETYTTGEIQINGDRRQAFVGTQSLDLTRREFELLRVLAQTPNRVLQRDDIYTRVWGYSMVRGDRSVDVFVRKLRSKLEAQSPDWRYIHTHFGVGYRFAAEPAATTKTDRRSASKSCAAKMNEGT